ncbi:MAG TPA: neutral zinc metallopeptidase [Acidobacteriota bacterium]|jgi:predicted metalloprotease|nr:neutral zinc metallopeptidase [Acidobacteriota bacterium]HPB28028.1 neutral zinc metallopeptidase [Acidobacteriota bacterium]HQO25249.1 neutral zinc metallopeptidase [Acidobacteriota bacterium]HQP74067.1 neutral zinc metallopeptidase [Acidobacteriota bacterium]
MRWRGERRSDNVEDRRGVRPAGLAIGGLGGIALIVIALLMGADPMQLLQQVGTTSMSSDQGGQVATNPEEDKLAEFVSVVLASTEDVWVDQFRQEGMAYQVPKLVLFTGQVQSACGIAGSATGPFYCPADQKVYIDLQFYHDLQNRFGAPGDFAQAYVIAHEIGHHVQNQLGILQKVHEAQQRVSKEQANQLSVRLELQADFLAGVWAHHTQRMRGLLESGDLEEALNAAAAIGDDRLQQAGQGYVVPDSFTHGTSEQRARWFRLGYETGDMNRGDTFNTNRL